MKASLISVLLAVAGFLVAAARINHGLVDSGLPSGPGLTPDESFNIQQGVYLFDAFMQHGPILFTRSGATEVFGSRDYLPDHPPLGRVVLGAAHQMTSWTLGGARKAAFDVPAARLGSCLLFAMTVLLLAEFSRRRFGIATAVAAAVALMLMPRVVGHARLASLETATSLAWLAACVPLWVWWTEPLPPTSRQCLISGLLWGVLLLTKVQGILLPPLVVGWALWRFRSQAVRPLVLWGLTGAVVFFVGWPWLWLDPIANMMQYLGRATDRSTLYVWYFGQRYADKAVPWHFPFVMTLITLPLILLIGFVANLFRRSRTPSQMLMLLSVVWPLIVFAVPGVPVYDGCRLFLIIMPPLALLAGRGLCLLAGFPSEPIRHQTPDQAPGTPSARSVSARLLIIGLLLLLAVRPAVDVLQAFALDSYSLVVGGPAGAEWLGMESSYWADGMNRDFWQQVPEDSVVYVAPICHQFLLLDLDRLVPVVAERNIRLRPFEYDPEEQRGLILLIHRLADLRPMLRTVPSGATVVAEARYRNVVLARLIDTTEATWPELPDWPDR
ncbi:MAG: glycosyltransferase family 39 protein [Fuerstiella sp.]